MKYRTFGSTGLEVSAIGFGAMPLSLTPARPSENDAIAVVHHAIDRGITLIDTADSYCIDTTEAGHNERLIGKAMAQLPEDIRSKVAIATKGGLLRPNGRWARNGRPEHLRGVCEQSLKISGWNASPFTTTTASTPKCLWLTASANSRGCKAKARSRTWR